jgi:hypothetical protein
MKTENRGNREVKAKTHKTKPEEKILSLELIASYNCALYRACSLM